MVQLSKQRLHTEWQQKVFTKLLGLQYRIVYKKGADNRVVDALSRRTAQTEECFSLSSSIPVWLEQVASSYAADSYAQSIITKLALDATAVPHFSWKNGLLGYQNRIWVGQVPEFSSSSQL